MHAGTRLHCANGLDYVAVLSSDDLAHNHNSSGIINMGADKNGSGSHTTAIESEEHQAFVQQLDDIDWSKYSHAYGPATNVKARLISLSTINASEQDELFKQMQHDFWSDVFHQGTRWEVSPKVVPFLVQILIRPQTDAKKREFLAEYLHCLAVGYPHDLFPDMIEWEALQAEAIAARQENAAEYSEYALYAWDTYEAVEVAIPSIVALMDSGNCDSASLASLISLCQQFPRKRDFIVPTLQQFASGSDLIASLALLTLVQLGVYEGVLQRAQAIYDKNDGSLSMVYAATADVLLKARTKHQEATTALTTAHAILLDSKWREDEIHSCPFAGSVQSLVNRMLVLLPSSAADAVIEVLGEYLKKSSGFGQMDTIGALFTVAGFEPVPAGNQTASNDLTTKEFSKTQRVVIRLLAEHVSWSNIIYANVSSIFRRYGLPYNKDKLIDILGPA